MTEPSAAVKREAAVWIARIHSPERTPAVDAGLRSWLQESPAHRRAFEMANELWDTAARIPDGALPRMMRWKRVATPKGFPFARLAAVAGVLAALAVITIALYQGSRGFFNESALTTGIGEQRTVTLQDGTRVWLNTATCIVVRYDERTRRIQLDSGEALFEISRRPQWPFVVMAGNRRIEALGTAFLVRRDGQQTAVTLVEGKVAVSPAPTTGGAGAAQPESTAAAKSGNPESPNGTVTLTPGERLTFAADGREAKLDRPKLEKLTAWQRGLVALDYTTLADAVAEMNRYSIIKLVIANPEAAGARISGVFRAGDSLFFAQAIAETYDLQFTEEEGRIVISGVPR